jgi:predicted nucleic acid-binding protein
MRALSADAKLHGFCVGVYGFDVCGVDVYGVDGYGVDAYGFEARDIAKRDRARSWISTCWQRRCGRSSRQVLDAHCLNRKKMFSHPWFAEAAKTPARCYQSARRGVMDQPGVDVASVVDNRDGQSCWDALVLAAGQQSGGTMRRTENLQRHQRIDGVPTPNPSIVGPVVLGAAA